MTTAWGGDVQIPWEKETYWPSLVQLAGERRKKHFEKWKALGGTIGISEYDIKREDEVVDVSKEAEKTEVPEVPNEKATAVSEIPAVEVTPVSA